MFQGPKGYIYKCVVPLQYGNSTTQWPFYTFSSKFQSMYNLFSLYKKTAKSYNSNFHIMYEAKWLHLLI